MRDEHETHPFTHIPFAQLRADSLRDIVESLAVRGNFECGFMPIHEVIIKDFTEVLRECLKSYSAARLRSISLIMAT